MTELTVFTFKEGLLSRVAHDLKIAVDRAEVVREADQLTVRVDATSLRVCCAMKKGAEDHRALSKGNRAEIERIIRADVLHTRQHSTIEYRGTIEGSRVVGTLTLCGVSQPVSLPWRAHDGVITGEITLDQRRFNIQPYRAMMGALKLKPDFKVTWKMRA